MCSNRSHLAHRPLRVLTTALVACLVSAQALPGQTTDAQRRLVTRLADRWRALSEAAARADTARQLAATVETLTAGSLTAITTPIGARRTEDAVRRLWSELEPILGPDSALLSRYRFYVSWYDSGEPLAIPRGDNIAAIRVNAEFTPRDLAARMKHAAEQWLASPTDSVLRMWIGERIPLVDTVARHELSRSYQALVTSPSITAQQCFLGNLEQCGGALLLREVDEPLLEWYDAEKRRFLVQQWVRGWGGAMFVDEWGGARSMYRLRCIESGLDAACVAYLRTVPLQHLFPLPRESHAVLMAVAVELGGAGAYGRLLRPEGGSIEDRLAATAGVSVDSLLAVWRTRVVGSRPAPTTLTRSSGWIAFLWIVVATLLATRSSRWR